MIPFPQLPRCIQGKARGFPSLWSSNISWWSQQPRGEFYPYPGVPPRGLAATPSHTHTAMAGSGSEGDRGHGSGARPPPPNSPRDGFYPGDQPSLCQVMVEFFRLRAITGDDLSEILRTWQADMEATMDKLLRDLDAATQTSTTLPSKNAAVGVALRQLSEATRLRMAFPLTRLDEAREEMGKFMRSRLKELRSQQETRNLIGELSSRITDHRGRVRQLLRSEPLRHPEVVPLILVGMAADRPLESNFFPGLWRDCWGVSALLPPGKAILPRHPGKVLATRGPQPCVRPSRGLSRRRWRHPEPLGCLNVWISITRRISSKDKDVKYHRSSWTHSSFLIWLRRCSMWSSLPWC